MNDLVDLPYEQAITRFIQRFADAVEAADFIQAERAVRMVIALEMIEEANDYLR